MFYARSSGLCLATIAIAVAAAGCGSSSSGSGASGGAPSNAGVTPASSGATTSATTQPAASSGGTGACGTIPTGKYDDPTGALARSGVTSTVRGYYEGLGHPVLKSAWANWKPSGHKPYKVAIVAGFTPNVFYAQTLTDLQQKLKASSLVNPSIPLTQPPSFTAISEQLQQYNAAVQQKPNLIIFDPASPTAAVSYVNAAGKRGIPTVTMFDPVDSKYAVNIVSNSYLVASGVAQQMVKELGGKGSILQVTGTPTALTTADETKAWTGVFDRCPNIKLVGSVTGDYSTTVAKTATLQYLSTHPGNIDGVIETAEMAQGIMQAFQQTGKTMPLIGQVGAENSVTAYWRDHLSSGYNGAAVTGGASDFSTLISQVALRTLAGQGPKLNYVPWHWSPITAATINQFIGPKVTTSSAGTVNNLPGNWLQGANLDSLFTNPKASTGS